MAEEKVYFQEGGYKVTNARVVCKGTTYALPNITSCRSTYTDHVGVNAGKKFLKTLIIIAAIALGIYIGIKAENYVIGIVIAVVGIIVSFFIKHKFAYKTFKVHFGSASGEQEAISSVDESFIDKFVAAVNDAMVQRSGGS